jgi:DNA polymerase III delta prime subunit
MAAVDFSIYLRSILEDRRYCDLCYVEPDAFLNLEEQKIKLKKLDSQEAKIEYFAVLKGLKKYALGQQRYHILLAGRPGSGKSTTLKQLLLEMARKALVHENRPIPVLVQLKGDRSIQDLIIAEFRRTRLRVTIEQIDDLLMDDKLLLLLDGVNEMPSDDLRRRLQDFREDNPTTPMIFTTRDLALGGDLGIEKQIEILPLKKPQMREFVLKYLPEYGDKLLRQLQDRFREIAETPLLLKMLCDVFDPVTQKIPKNKGELFLEFDQKYRKLKQDAPVYNDFWLFRSELLAHLAFVMINGDPQKPTDAWLTISRHQAEIILEEWLTQRRMEDAPTKAKRWLEYLLEHDLLQVAADVQQIEFHHQLFQEFYAAIKLKDMFQDSHPDLMDEKRLQYFYLNYLKWTEVISSVLSLTDGESIATQILHSALNVDLIFGHNLIEVIHESNVSSNLRFTNDIHEINRRIIQSHKISSLKNKKYLDFHDEDEGVEKCDRQLNLISVLRNDKSSHEEREMAIFELSEYSEDSTVAKELYSVLDNSEQDEHLQLIMTRLLLELGFPISDNIINKILTGNNNTAKKSVIELMDITKHAWAIPQLLAMLSEDDYIINSAIIPFIIKTKDPLGLCYATKYLLELDNIYLELDDFDRFQANNRFLGYLLQDLVNEPSLIQTMVLPNLNHMCSEENLFESFKVISDVNSSKSEQWISTVESLARIDYQPAINIIIFFLKSIHIDETFRESINIVRRIHLKQAIPVLISILEESPLPSHKKLLVVEILSEFKVASTLPLLSRLRNSVLISPGLNITIQPERVEITLISYQRAVERVQSSCGFYNYEIFKNPPEAIPSGTPIIYQIFNVEQVGNLNTGSVQVHGDMIGEKHN